VSTLLVASCSNVQGPIDQTPGAADPREQNQASGAGDYARDFLTDTLFDELQIEVDWIVGHEPSDAALAELAAALGELCRKPAGIQILKDDEIAGASSPAWSLDAIDALEVQHRDGYRDTTNGVAVMYVLYLDGHSDRDSGSGKVLGIAYHGSSTVLFHETIESVDPGVPLFAGIEDTVLLHEAGHLLGLVENGIPMVNQHRDSQHGAHDSSAECIMHWTIETQNVVEVLLEGKPDFDAACRADMVSAGGRP
jgi:hypothetical protein